MSNATISGTTRRTWGPFRPIFAVYCADCTWRTETADVRLAEAIRQRHVCEEDE